MRETRCQNPLRLAATPCMILPVAPLCERRADVAHTALAQCKTHGANLL